MLINNPIRAALQRHVEARRFLRMGGPLRGGRALEIGCGRGVGVATCLCASYGCGGFQPWALMRLDNGLRAGI